MATRFLTDMSDKPARVTFDVATNGQPFYLEHLVLRPHETRAIDLRRLRDAQQPDSDGHKIPAGVTDGSVHWNRIDNVPVMGQLVVLKRHGAVASSYDCCTCPCPDVLGSISVSPSNPAIAIGATQAFTDTPYFYNCNGQPGRGEALIDWSSSPTSVATMSGATATAVGGGTADIIANAPDSCENYTKDPLSGECLCDLQGITGGAASLTVLYPASLSIVASTDSTTKEATCSAGTAGTGCGVTRTFTYQVLDQNGHAMTGSWIASQQFWDVIVTVTSGPNGLGLTSYNTTCNPSNKPCGKYVNSQGQFEELNLGACSTVCYVKSACVTAGYTAATQTWNIGSYLIANSVSYYCNKVLWNGH